ncbi:MAG TPA: PAS domain S-box protein, partial [Proteobacteria bacterium]|nr:PAS domain S-box protein [Pseudomonadota bacterium]
MSDEHKSRAQLLKELAKLRKRLAELEAPKTEGDKPEASFLETKGAMSFLFRESPVFNVIIGPNGHIKDISRAPLQEAGYSREEIIGKHVLEFIVPEDREKALAEIEKGFKGEETAELEIGIYARDGSVRTVLFSAGQALLYEGDRLAGILFTGVDITERKRAEDDLRKSEERYRLVVENASEAIVVAQDEVLRFVNPKAVEISGYSKEELTSMPFIDLVHPADRDMVMDRHRRRMRGERVPERYAFRIITRDGKVRWLEVNAVRIEWEGGPATLNFLTDITERRLAEQALIESEREKQVILDSLTAYVIYHSTDMRIVWANRSAAESLGMAPKQLIGRRCYELWNRRDEPCRGCPVVEALKTGNKQMGEVQIAEGRFWMVRAYPVRSSSGNMIGVVETVQDITEHKHAEKALRESEKRYRQLVESFDVIIYKVGKDGRFTYVNSAAEHVSGYSKDEIIGKHYTELIRPDFKEKVISFYKDQCDKKVHSTYFEFPIIRKDGREVWIGQNVQAIVEDGQLVGFQAVAQDITGRKELIRIEKLESLGMLAGGIAHDFNNLLMGIMGNISLAKVHAELGSEVFKRLTEAEKAAAQARNLTQQLLTFSRGGVPVKKTISLAELIEEAADFSLRGSNVRCEFSLPDDLWSIEADEGQISQVIQNIVLNADQAMPEGGTIRIAAENMEVGSELGLPLEPGRYVRISIADHGIGIPPEHLRKIFDPYFTTKQHGSGLGLATAYSVVKNHNGYIDVDSQLGVGTTFFIYLPASRSEPAKEDEVEEKPIKGRGRVLLMDDEEIVRNVACSMIESLGYRVELAK